MNDLYTSDKYQIQFKSGDLDALFGFIGLDTREQAPVEEKKTTSTPVTADIKTTSGSGTVKADAGFETVKTDAGYVLRRKFPPKLRPRTALNRLLNHGCCFYLNSTSKTLRK